MPQPLAPETLAEVLPGSWAIRATTFPMWRSGRRRDPHLTYDLVSTGPLTLGDLVTYRTASGATRSIRGVDTWKGDRFVWRGSGPLRVLRSRWRVTGASEDREVLVIRFDRSLVTPAGIDVLTPSGGSDVDPRLAVAADPDALGLGEADLASLQWL